MPKPDERDRRTGAGHRGWGAHAGRPGLRRHRRPRRGPGGTAAGLIVALLAPPVAFGISDLIGEGSLTRLGDDLVEGLAIGAIWALIAVGYTLVYGVVELINIAHGDVFMIGSFVSFGLYGTLGLSTGSTGVGLALGLLGTLLTAMVACGALSVMMDRVAYRPLRDAPRLAPLIASVGFSFILQNVGELWVGPRQVPRSVPDLIDTNHQLTSIAGVPITNGQVAAIAVAAPLIALVAALVDRTRIGRAIRATAQDRQAALLMGINVDTTISVTFLIAGLLAGAAGLVYALSITTIHYAQGFQAGLIAFTAAAMGGLGNVYGAVAGAVAIGFIQQLADSRIGGEWTSAIVFAYLILVLSRPAARPAPPAGWRSP
jgi:branched-chain amino acid transport system permease protein